MPNLTRIAIVTLVLNSLNSCGFQPVYKNDVLTNTVNYESELAAIEISGDRKRVHQKLSSNLEEVLNPNKINIEKKYDLNIKTTKSTAATFINTTGSSGRNKVTLKADYTLKRISDGEIIAVGNALAKDDFDVESRRFANYITEEAIELNLTRLIAQNIRDLLINDLFNSQSTD